jgi:hypothetical protein
MLQISWNSAIQRVKEKCLLPGPISCLTRAHKHNRFASPINYLELQHTKHSS